MLPIAGSGDTWTNYSMYKELPKRTALFMVQTNTGVTLGVQGGVGKMFLGTEANNSRNIFRTITWVL